MPERGSSQTCAGRPVPPRSLDRAAPVAWAARSPRPAVVTGRASPDGSTVPSEEVFHFSEKSVLASAIRQEVQERTREAHGAQTSHCQAAEDPGGSACRVTELVSPSSKVTGRTVSTLMSVLFLCTSNEHKI